MTEPLRQPRCRGLWGFIAGHKFKMFAQGITYDNCTRCGLAAQR